MTLLELMIALVIMAIVGTLVTPTFRLDREEGASLDQVVRRGRELAARRGEALLLKVGGDGSWRVSPGAESDTVTLLNGAIAGVDRRAFTIELTELGACIPRSQLPPPLAGWDAGRCAVDSLWVASR